MTAASLDTVIVFTTDMERLARFYVDAFELDEPQRQPGHLGVAVGGVYLGFDEVPEERLHPGAVSIWIRVDDVDDVFERLVRLGATVGYPPVDKPWGDRLASLFDPDGNTVGISQRR